MNKTKPKEGRKKGEIEEGMERESEKGRREGEREEREGQRKEERKGSEFIKR